MIELRNITKYYQNANQTVCGVKGIFISFPSKGFFALSGPSGCGKSTLLNILGGVDFFDQGILKIDGQVIHPCDYDRYKEYTQHFSFIPQKPLLSNDYSVLANVLLTGIKNIEAYEILSLVSLKKKIFEKAKNLSDGEKQRLSIAIALGKHSSVLLADEPLANLDGENKKIILNILEVLSKDILVIMVSHEVMIENAHLVEMKDHTLLTSFCSKEDEPFKYKENKQPSCLFLLKLLLTNKRLIFYLSFSLFLTLLLGFSFAFVFFNDSCFSKTTSRSPYLDNGFERVILEEKENSLREVNETNLLLYDEYTDYQIIFPQNTYVSACNLSEYTFHIKPYLSTLIKIEAGNRNGSIILGIPKDSFTKKQLPLLLSSSFVFQTQSYAISGIYYKEALDDSIDLFTTEESILHEVIKPNSDFVYNRHNIRLSSGTTELVINDSLQTNQIILPNHVSLWKVNTTLDLDNYRLIYEENKFEMSFETYLHLMEETSSLSIYFNSSKEAQKAIEKYKDDYYVIYPFALNTTTYSTENLGLYLAITIGLILINSLSFISISFLSHLLLVKNRDFLIALEVANVNKKTTIKGFGLFFLIIVFITCSLLPFGNLVRFPTYLDLSFANPLLFLLVYPFLFVFFMVSFHFEVVRFKEKNLFTQIKEGERC